jgi:RNA polymerase sigma-70 factor (ECF subfamily)
VSDPAGTSHATTGAGTAATDGAATAVPDAEFVQLFTRSQRRLYLYILSQVPSPLAAEEILQEANVIVWSKFRQFQPGTNFLAWCTQIANYEIMKFRTRRKRDRLQFSDEFIQQVAEEAVERSDELELRRTALLQCIQKLRPHDRELIQQRYAPGETGKNLAEVLGRPANSVYQSLGRIRRALWDCVQRRLATGT